MLVLAVVVGALIPQEELAELVSATLTTTATALATALRAVPHGGALGAARASSRALSPWGAMSAGSGWTARRSEPEGILRS